MLLSDGIVWKNVPQSLRCCDFAFQEGMDRISGLSDDILCHILSFLPTKHAVACGILSTRWKYLWTSVPVLDFDSRLHQGFCPIVNINVDRRSEINFQNFVSRVLLLNDIPYIRKLRLIYECLSRPTVIRTWLNVLISHKLEELELDVGFSVQDDLVQLPRKFFTSNALVVMKLSRMALNVPSFSCFPKLKILELRRMFLDDKGMQNLLSACKVLEELVIEEIARENPKVVHVSIRTLRSFSFSYRFVTDTMVDRPYQFIINAPNLEYFHVKGRISDVFVIERFETLINAHLDFRRTAVPAESYSICHQNICDLLKKIANVKFLSLSSEIVQLLCAVYNQSLPRFPNLKELAFGIRFDFCWKRLVAQFIKCSPSLEVFSLNNKLGILRDIDELRKTPPRPLTGYLLSCLRCILIEELYANFLPEYVEYLMRDINILKRLRINCQCPIVLRGQIGLTSEFAEFSI